MSISRCNACLMPENKLVTISTNGCTYCESKVDVKNAPAQMVPSDNLNFSLERVKQVIADSDSKYDCIVGITGGRDSGFLLYYVKEVMGLNPIAVNYDTGFVTDIAKKNMEKYTDTLGVDFESFRLDGVFNRKLTQGFFKFHGEFCSPCHQGHEFAMEKVAKAYNIPIYIRGIHSEGDFNYIDSNYSGYYCKSEKEFNDKIINFADDVGITKAELERHQDFLHIKDWSTGMFRVDLPDFYDIPHDFKATNNVLEEKFEWKFPEGQYFHADCTINPILEYLKFRKHGYSGKNVQVSNLLKNSEITLDEGRKLLLSDEVMSLPLVTQNFLKYLDMEIPEFEAVLDKFWR